MLTYINTDCSDFYSKKITTMKLKKDFIWNLNTYALCYLAFNINWKKSLILYSFAYKVQPSSDEAEHTPCPEESSLYIQRKVPSPSGGGRNSDSDPPLVVSSGTGSADINFDALKTQLAPVTGDVDESPVHLPAISERTSELVSAAPPATTFGISHDTRVNPPVTNLEPVKIDDGTDQNTAYEKDQKLKLRMYSQVSCCMWEIVFVLINC